MIDIFNNSLIHLIQNTCHCEGVNGSERPSQSPNWRNINEITTSHSTNAPRNDKKAFTLAEVLITLGVIGVVSALTMPTLIKNYQKKVAVQKLKTTYSIVSQAVQFAISEYGEITLSNNAYGCSEAVNISKKYFEPYLKVDKKCDCKQTGYCYFNPSNISGLDAEPTYRYIYYTNRAQTLFLTNGAEILISVVPGHNGNIVIIIDINGTAKPNVYGKDVFWFIINKEGKILAFPTQYNYSRESYINECKTWGEHCSSLIMNDGFEMKDDYPW